MNKYLKTTLGRKLLAFYLAMFAITFYLISTFGHQYIADRISRYSPHRRYYATWHAH